MQPAQLKRENVQIVQNYRLNALHIVSLKSESLFYFINHNLGCCARNLLSIQPDFLAQKRKIEESIKKLANAHHYQVIFYPKYYCKLNHIEYFWCYAK